MADCYARPDLFVQAGDLAPGAGVALFGAGAFGRRALALLRRERPDVPVLAFLDSRKAGPVDGLPVLRPDDPAARRSLVLITSPAWHGLAVALLDAGCARFSVLRVCGEADHPQKTYAPRDARLLYVRNAKAASTSILAALETLSPCAVQDTFRDLPRPAGRLAFSFVRDPLRRMVSAQRMAFGGPGNALGRTVCRLLGRRTLDLAGFAALLEREPAWAMDSHWKPQHYYVAPDLDFTGRVECFAHDMARLGRLAGCALPAPHLHRSAGGPVRLPGAVRAVAERVYARDLECFGG